MSVRGTELSLFRDRPKDSFRLYVVASTRHPEEVEH
jgi:hypothetical protein